MPMDPVLPRPTAMLMDPMEMPRNLMAMPGPTAALQQDAIARAHGYGKLSSGEIYGVEGSCKDNGDDILVAT